MSFANSTKQERIGASQLNKHINMQLKHKSLDDAEALYKAEFNIKSQMVAEGLLDVKKNGIPFFQEWNKDQERIRPTRMCVLNQT